MAAAQSPPRRGRALRIGRVRAWARIARSALNRYWRDDGDAMAGYIAYSCFLSLFPFAIFATALAGVIIGPRDADEILDALLGLAPEHIALTLAPVVKGVTEGASERLATISAVAGLWVASNAVESIRVAFDRAYAAPSPRSFVRRRARALGFVLLATLIFGLLGLLVIAAPLALSMAETRLGFSTPWGLGLVRHGLGLAVLAFFLFQLHLLLPTRRPPRRRLWPGIWVSAALWTVAALGFSVYLAWAPSYAATYGAFAGVIVTLLFFYLTGAAIILGAQVNAALTAFRPNRPRDET